MELPEIKKNTISEINTSLDVIENRLDTVVKITAELEDLTNQFIHSEAQILKN